MTNPTTQPTIFAVPSLQAMGETRCDLVYLPKDSDILPTSETLAQLPLLSNVAYVRNQKHQKLFYIDKTEKVCTKITLQEKVLKKFDELLEPDSLTRSKQLQPDDLDVMAAYTGHTHLRYQKLNRLIAECPENKTIPIRQEIQSEDGSKESFPTTVNVRDFLWNRYKQTFTDELVTLVAKGKLKEAEAMIAVNPFLLLEKGTYTDFSGRTRTRTAFQAALAAQDVALKPGETEMAEMIAGYLDALEAENHTTEENNKRAQYQAQFPPGWEEEKKRRLNRSITSINTFFTAVRNAPDNVDLNEHCKEALEAYRTYFREEYIEQKFTPDTLKNAGTDFEEEVLVALYEVYDRDYEANDGWDSAKNKFVWQKGVGFPQRFASAQLASNLCQGIYSLVEEGEKPRRQWVFRYDPNVRYFPLDLGSNFRLGYEYAPWPGLPGGLFWIASLPGSRWRVACGAHDAGVEKLCRAKTASLERLMREPDQRPQGSRQPGSSCTLI